MFFDVPLVAQSLTGLHSGYLRGRQLDVWHMMQEGYSQSEIARKLDITRQAVNQLAQTIPERVMAALSDAAKVNGVQPKQIDTSKGILVGWSRDFQTDAVITFSPKDGVRVWYKHNLGKCSICPDRQVCKSTLLRTARDLGVPLKPQDRHVPPSKLSSLIFSRLSGGS
jgi:transcriptional regulator